MQTPRLLFPTSHTVCLAPNRRVKIRSSKLPLDFFKGKPTSICKFQSSRISTKQQDSPPTPAFPQIKGGMTSRMFPHTQCEQRTGKNNWKSSRGSMERQILGESSKYLVGVELPRIFSERW